MAGLEGSDDTGGKADMGELSENFENLSVEKVRNNSISF